MSKILDRKFKKIKLLAMDFDGVMTDGCVYVEEDGDEAVKCSRKDGLGIELLKRHGLKAIVISKETNRVVAARCRKLAIPCVQAVKDGESKLGILRRFANKKKIAFERVAYMGDDLNDINVLKNVGLAITVADGHPLAKRVCDYITKARGGQHAVREVCEKILLAQGHPLTF